MFLQRILERKEEEVAALRPRADELAARASEAPPPRGFLRTLRSASDVAVIAEFKRRSPSAGELAPGADPARVAAIYEAAGARAISVLTDGEHFGGSLDDLRAARAGTRVPVLRKDFLLDPVQVHEARAVGADAVLLIVRILDDPSLRDLLAATRSVDMEALVEVHDEEELDRAVRAGARCIGVNARDLSSFGVDLSRSERLLRRVPGDLVAVAESGIRGPGDVDRMGAAGADAVLVGTALMEGDPGSLLERLVGRSPEAASPGVAPGAPPANGSRPAGGAPGVRARPADASASGMLTAGHLQMESRADGVGGGSEPRARVKICGLTRRADVRAAADAGASFGGLVFAESPRRVSAEEAAGLVRDAGLRPVGVFVDPDPDEVLRIASRVPLETVQLHGRESGELCETLRGEGLSVWKAVRPRSPEELRERARHYLHAVDALLVEGYSADAAGGTGASVPLSWVESLRSVLGSGSPRAVRLVLAGGLTPENVGPAVRRVRPDVVDVSSGVERRPGEKSPERIRAFVTAASRAGDEGGGEPVDEGAGESRRGCDGST